MKKLVDGWNRIDCDRVPEEDYKYKIELKIVEINETLNNRSVYVTKTLWDEYLKKVQAHSGYSKESIACNHFFLTA